MAHFAKLDDNNNVTQIIVVDNEKLLVDGIETEAAGVAFLNSLGLGDKWVQTSYNKKFRNKFAAIGDIYDTDNSIFVEREGLAHHYDSHWQGINNPTSPSIIIDSAMRSANRWLIETTHAAFPDVFQRWGYLHPHNPQTFGKAKDKFDITIAIVRKPLDSLASSLIAFRVKDDSAIEEHIKNTIEILKAIKDNQNELTVFRFEQVTNDLDSVMQEIGNKLKIQPLEIDQDAVKSKLANQAVEHFYSVPIDNEDELNQIKEILSELKFASLMEKANTLYDEIIAI